MSSKIVLNNKKQFVMVKGKDKLGYIPRFYWKKGNKTWAPSVLIKCGDCKNKVKVYYDVAIKLIHSKKKVRDNLIEINGVLAHKEFWKLLFKKIGLI